MGARLNFDAHSGVEAGEFCIKRSLDSIEHITSIATDWDDARPDDLQALSEEVCKHDADLRQDVGLIADIKVDSCDPHTEVRLHSAVESIHPSSHRNSPSCLGAAK